MKTERFYQDIIRDRIEQIDHAEIERRLKKARDQADKVIARLKELRACSAKDLRRESTI